MKQSRQKPVPNASPRISTAHSHSTSLTGTTTTHIRPISSQHRAPPPTSLRSRFSRSTLSIATPSSLSRLPSSSISSKSARHASSYSHLYSSNLVAGHDFDPSGRPKSRSTTILCVRKGDQVVMMGDGQVSLGPTIIKPNAKKIRRIGGGKVIVGFAGSTADAFTLVEVLDSKLDEYPGQLLRAAVETAKGWRTDKYTRHLEAMLIASDENISLCISGNGDVIESHDGLLGVGSGSMYALAAARALIDIDNIDALSIAKKAMNIAADICVYTNHNFIIDSINIPPAISPSGSSDNALSSPMAKDAQKSPAKGEHIQEHLANTPKM